MAKGKRLIDANALDWRARHEMMEELFQNWKQLPCEVRDMICKHGNEFERLLKEAPTVDAVEVKSKVGDLVYALWEAPVKLKYIIYCAEVKEIRISIRNARMTTTYILEPIAYRGRRREYRDDDFGKLVFWEEDQAERALYPCEHCISGTYRSCEGCSNGERRTDV